MTFVPEAAPRRPGQSASNLHSTMRIGDPAKGSNPAETPMEMLAAPIGLFAPSQIGRCPVGRARTETDSIADLHLLIAGQSKAT